MTVDLRKSCERFHTPEVVTKQLKMNAVGDRHKVRLSSNFLPLMGFMPDSRMTVRELKDGGFRVSSDPNGDHKVHLRRYRRGRSNNPLEAVVEFASQKLIGQTFPPGTERFQIQMRQNQLLFKPLPNRAFNIRQRFSGKNPLKTLVALTGGIDIHCLEQLGFTTEMVVEHRPEEARDRSQGRSLQEVHALSALRNGRPRVLVNEDIYQLDPAVLRQLMDEGDPISVAHFSVGCDDFSNLKSASLKKRSVDDMTTMVDMIHPVLNQISALEAPVVTIENVRGFQSSGAGTILQSMLRRWGYHLTPMVLNARDYGGIQNRERFYLVASLFPGFTPPAPEERNSESIWHIIKSHLHECRDVSESKTVQNRGKVGRNVPPLLTPDSTYCPTITKSQGRGVRDAVYIEHEGRILAPSEGLLKKLMSIPENLDLGWMAQEQAIETLGQSLDYAMHHRLMEAVKTHVEANLGPGPILRHSSQMALAL